MENILNCNKVLWFEKEICLFSATTLTPWHLYDLLLWMCCLVDSVSNGQSAVAACNRLAELQEFRSSRTVKVNPDRPQQHARFLALEVSGVRVRTWRHCLPPPSEPGRLQSLRQGVWAAGAGPRGGGQGGSWQTSGGGQAGGAAGSRARVSPLRVCKHHEVKVLICNIVLVSVSFLGKADKVVVEVVPISRMIDCDTEKSLIVGLLHFFFKLEKIRIWCSFV